MEAYAEDFKIRGFANIKYGPATIFAGKIDILNINLLYADSDTSTSPLRPVLSKMYYILRNVVLVLFMSVLVYTGIKITISSTSNQDKAKYKEMLKDWLIGILLLFTLHFIMIGISIVSGKILDIFSWITISPEGTDVLFSNIRNAISISESVDKIGYTIMYLVLIMYTLMFTVQYVKRLIYVAFLTLIAPFVALTYPIDKMKDGKAQAFNMWLKEYVYNVLIQVVHIILYYVFIEAAIELAGNNPIYALVAIGFLIPAEKILKSMFGFNAQGGIGKPPSLLAGALTMQAVGALRRRLTRGGSSENNNKNNDNSDNSGNNIRTADSGRTANSLLSSNENSSDQENSLRDENNNQQEEQNGQQEQNDPVLEKYKNDGYRQDANANGLYFDPSRDDYFEDYDPHNDEKNYQQTEQQAMQEQSNSQPEPQPEPQIETPQDEENKQPGFMRRKYEMAKNKINSLKFRGAMAVAGHYTGKVLKTGVKLYGAAGVGMLGVAAGLASDDFSNVFKYGAAGAGAGYLLGGKAFNVPSNIANRIRNSEAKQIYRSYTDPNDKAKNEELDKRWLKDKDNTRMYANQLNVSMEKAREMKEKYAKEYRKYGVSDDKTILKAMQLQGNYGDLASKDRLAAAVLAGRVKNSKDLKDLRDNLQKNARTDAEKERLRRVADAVQKINDIV